VRVEELQRSNALETRDGALTPCQDGKRAVVAEVIAGRMALPEAAERFRELPALLDDGQDDTLGSYAVAEDEEGMCRSILSWVAVLLLCTTVKPSKVIV